MFYHQEILKRRGHFGIVWLAATKSAQLSKRELCTVDIRKVCDDIIDTIMMRSHPLIPGGRRPRFSLYLSSQLMYGVVQIHKKHCEFLFGEANTFFTRIRLALTSLEDIDLKSYPRLDMVTNTDIVEISGQNQIGFDPQFGCLKLDEEDVLSTLHYPDMFILFLELELSQEMWRVESSIVVTGSPRGSPKLSIPTTPVAKERQQKEKISPPHTVSSPEEITLKEIDMRIPEIEMPELQQELPAFDGREMISILEEAALEPIKLTDLMSPVIQSIISDETGSRLALSPKEKTPHTRSEDEVPIRQEVPPSPGITPAVATEEDGRPARRIRPSLTLELTPVTPSPARRRRKRLFADKETQIHKSQMRENMKTGHDTCHPFVVPDTAGSSVTELFNRPGRSELKCSPLLQLWRKNAKYGICETESDMAVPIWSVPELQVEEQPVRKRRRVTPPPLEMSPVVEVQKELSPDHQRILSPEVQLHRTIDEILMEQEMPSMEVPRETSISMERSRAETPAVILAQKSDHDISGASDKEESISKRTRRRTRSSKGGTSSEEEIEPSLIMEPLISESAIALPTVHEEIEINHIHQSPVRDMPSPIEDRLIRNINRQTQKEKWTTFREVCPPMSNNRSQAAKLFSTLLDLCTDFKVQAKQKAPFEDIFICRGKNM